jgi:hypothetical protein
LAPDMKMAPSWDDAIDLQVGGLAMVDGSGLVIVGAGELTAGAGEAEDPIGSGSARNALVERTNGAVADAMTFDVRAEVRDVLLAGSSSADDALAWKLLLH